jgi:hypothetical protein
MRPVTSADLPTSRPSEFVKHYPFYGLFTGAGLAWMGPPTISSAVYLMCRL